MFSGGGYASLAPLEPLAKKKSRLTGPSAPPALDAVQRVPTLPQPEGVVPAEEVPAEEVQLAGPICVGNSGSPVLGNVPPDGDVLKKDDQKSDNAEVPVHLWDEFLWETWPSHFRPLKADWRKCLKAYRTLGLSFWKQCRMRSFWWFVSDLIPEKVWKEKPMPRHTVYWDCISRSYKWARKGRVKYQRWMKRLLSWPDTLKYWGPARECIEKAAAATWWEWDEGSRPFFWLWEPSARDWACDGQPHFQTQELPKFTKPQQAPKTEEDRIMVWKKLSKVRKRRYIDTGEVVTLMHYFYVPKGTDDIRMVYNGTASGVNDCLFAPHFSLPTISHVARALAPNYYQADLDVGEMFLNFMLGKALRPYSGVDVSHVKTRKSDFKHHGPEPLVDYPDWEKGRVKRWERWVRNWMGMRDSPYRSGQLMIIAKEMAYGDRHDPSNPFQWELVILNLPGSPNRNPMLPWVYKLRADGLIASEAFIYVDDNRVVAATKIQAWWAARRLASTLSNLGLQDAARKRTYPPLRLLVLGPVVLLTRQMGCSSWYLKRNGTKQNCSWRSWAR